MCEKYLLITAGDPAGIGYEVIFKIINQIHNFIPVLIAEKYFVNYYLKHLKINLNPIFISEDFIFDSLSIIIPDNSFLCIETENKKNFNYRNSFLSKKTGFSAISYINKAIYIIKKLQANNKTNFFLLTMPVSKDYITQVIGNKFLGHTEYITKHFGIKNYSMLMIGKDKNNKSKYNVLLLTRHIPIKYISKNLSFKDIVNQIFNTVKYLENYFYKKNIEILICGLNPHNGEQGKIGTEEKIIFKKVVEKLKTKLRKNKIISPILTEKAFEYAKNKNNVLIVCSYHDQGMVPLKLLCGHNIANLTIGLPFVRISPGHGTAFDIARKNVADINPTMFCIELLNNLCNL